MTRGRPRLYDYAAIERMAETGMTKRDIAVRLATSVPAIHYALKQAAFGKLTQEPRRRRTARQKPIVRLRLCHNPACGTWFPVTASQYAHCSIACRNVTKKNTSYEKAAQFYALAVELNSSSLAARETGFTREYGRQLLSKNGFPTRIYHAAPKPEKPILDCTYCGKPCGHKRGRSGNRFCNSTCRNAFTNTKEVPRNRRVCAYCGIVFYRKNTRSPKEANSPWYCSRAHYHAASTHPNPPQAGRKPKPLDSYPCTCKGGEHIERHTTCKRGRREYERAVNERKKNEDAIHNDGRRAEAAAGDHHSRSLLGEAARCSVRLSQKHCRRLPHPLDDTVPVYARQGHLFQDYRPAHLVDRTL